MGEGVAHRLRPFPGGRGSGAEENTGITGLTQHGLEKAQHPSAEENTGITVLTQHELEYNTRELRKIPVTRLTQDGSEHNTQVLRKTQKLPDDRSNCRNTAGYGPHGGVSYKQVTGHEATAR